MAGISVHCRSQTLVTEVSTLGVSVSLALMTSSRRVRWSFPTAFGADRFRLLSALPGLRARRVSLTNLMLLCEMNFVIVTSPVVSHCPSRQAENTAQS